MEQSTNEMISFGGVQVRPGDVVMCDRSGVVIVPWEHVDEVLTKAEELYDKEEAMLAEILATGDILGTALPIILDFGSIGLILESMTESLPAESAIFPVGNFSNSALLSSVSTISVSFFPELLLQHFFIVEFIICTKDVSSGEYLCEHRFLFVIKLLSLG